MALPDLVPLSVVSLTDSTCTGDVAFAKGKGQRGLVLSWWHRPTGATCTNTDHSMGFCRNGP